MTEEIIVGLIKLVGSAIGTSYQAYNQRHNSDYSVFKIIAYKQ